MMKQFPYQRIVRAFWVVFLSLALWPPTHGKEFDPQFQGHWPAEHRGLARSVAVSDGYAYVAAGDLQIIDVSDPTDPRWMLGYDAGGIVQGVTVSGSLTYIAVAGYGLQILDISAPAQPRKIGGIKTSSDAMDVRLRDNRAYVAVADGLEVIEVSTPASPRSLGRYQSHGGINRVAVSDNYAYLAGVDTDIAAVEDVQVIDLADPSQLKRVGVYDSGWDVQDLAISGNYLHVASIGVGLSTLDISDPASPRLVSTYTTDMNAAGVAIFGHYGVLSSGTAGLHLLDFSNPTVPPTRISLARFQDHRSMSTVTINGNFAYVAANLDDDFLGLPLGSVLQVVDLSDPAHPRLAGEANAGHETRAVAVSGSYAFLADANAGLQVIDLSDSTQLRQVGGFRTVGHAHDVVLGGRYAYVADGESGLQIVDVAQPTNPTPAGRTDTTGFAEAVVLAGHYAYVADGEAGLQVLDVSNPFVPALVGGLDTSGYAKAIAIARDHVFIADRAESLKVINVANPRTPRLVTTLEGKPVADLVTSGNFLFAAGGPFLVYDISDPRNPKEIASYTGNVSFNGIKVSGDYAYLTGDLAIGLHIVDISNPASPSRAAFCDEVFPFFEQSRNALAVTGEHVLLADGRGGLTMIKMNPANPVRLGEYDAFTQSLAWSRNHVYLAVNGVWNGSAFVDPGMHVVDVSNPSHPQKIGAYRTKGEGVAVGVERDRAYLLEEGVVEFGQQSPMSLDAIDVSDPTNPQQISRSELRRRAQQLAIHNDRVYVWFPSGALPGEIEVINVSDPKVPQSLFVYQPNDWTHGLPASRNLVYTPDLAEGWLVTEKTSDGTGTFLGGYKTLASLQGTAVSGKYAYQAVTRGFGFETGQTQVLDISDPANPREIASYPRGGFSLVVEGHYAFVGGIGLDVFDISSPFNPRRVGRNAAPAFSTGTKQLAVVGGRGYAAGWDGKFVIFEMLPFFNSLSRKDTELHLSWEGWDRARLQRATQASNSDWQDIPSSGTSAILPAGAGNGFFRLKSH